jgi:hypothetical protein
MIERIGVLAFPAICVAVEGWSRSFGFPNSHFALQLLYWAFVVVMGMYGGLMLLGVVAWASLAAVWDGYMLGLYWFRRSDWQYFRGTQMAMELTAAARTRLDQGCGLISSALLLWPVVRAIVA